MFWLEMSRDEAHGGGDWAYTKSLWSPAYKINNSKWRHWETVLEVQKGDQVLHLRGVPPNAKFEGFSTAASNGFETTQKPPILGEYAYAECFYRVYLEDFQRFNDPIYLQAVFEKNTVELLKYFLENKSKPKRERKPLFYVHQSRRIQCFNGGYLSEVDNQLASLLLGSSYSNNRLEKGDLVTDVKTSERIQQLKIRVGQKEFSSNVRSNYGGQCCFPGCSIHEDIFLIGAHIDRWADNETLRGNSANGLCLCLMHDKAFELGLFTINENYSIVVNHNRIRMLNSTWVNDDLLPYDGQPIKQGNVIPSQDALRAHRARAGVDI